MSGVKIVSLDIENVKRVQAVSLEPVAAGLTVIGGDNNQGKTSVLDAIMVALGGESKMPSNALREGTDKGAITIELSNGITVQRTFTGRGSYLKVSGANGHGGQSLLNEFVNTFALDLSTFLGATDKERANILMGLIGLDLTPLDEKYKKLYADREAVGRLATRAKAHAEAMPFDAEAGLEPMTPTDIMDELQRKLAKNAANANLRANVVRVQESVEAAEARLSSRRKRVAELRAALAEAEADEANEQIRLADTRRDLVTAQSNAQSLQDEDVAALKAKIGEIDAANARVRKNLEREKALTEAEGHKEEYAGLTDQMKDILAEKQRLLEQAALPLPGLGIADSVLTYDGRAWDCMSHSAQLRVATAICRAIKPSQGFVLLDKLEAMDMDTLRAFGVWLETEGLQAIATRVSKGGECSIVISDGMVEGVKQKKEITFD
jgi:DNA repair exonuclease SbcCD ATPase subunit